MPTLWCCRDGRLPCWWLAVTSNLYRREVELLGPHTWTPMDISRTISIHEFATASPDSTVASVASRCAGWCGGVFDHLNLSSESFQIWISFYMIVHGWVDELMLCILINGCAACWKEVLLISNLNVCVYILNFQAHIVGIAISLVVKWVECLCNHYSNEFKVGCSKFDYILIPGPFQQSYVIYKPTT